MTILSNRKIRSALLTATSFSSMIFAHPVMAQNTSAQDQSEAARASHADPNQLGDIVVVADKREVNLQKAPLAITALSSDTLKSNNILSPVDLNGFVPGLTVARSEGVNRVVSIRGIGNEATQNDGAQPGVAYHIDGVYIASPVALNADFLDVERVDVLRGPQGTVFGQNSTGGTINVISRQPKLDRTEGYVDVGGGNYNLFRGEAALNVPISSTIAVRASILGIRHDGFAKATEVPGHPNGYDLEGRIFALWQPVSNFSLVLGFEDDNLDENDRAQKSVFDPNPDPRRLTQDYPGKFYVGSQIYSARAKWDLGGITVKNTASF